jgi:hypothetical protein
VAVSQELFESLVVRVSGLVVGLAQLTLGSVVVVKNAPTLFWVSFVLVAVEVGLEEHDRMINVVVVLFNVGRLAKVRPFCFAHVLDNVSEGLHLVCVHSDFVKSALSG